MRRVADRDERVVTSAETFQELLHRYRAIAREDALQHAWDQTLAIVDEVLPIEYDDVERAKAVQLARGGLTARDALHVAVMDRQGAPGVKFDVEGSGYGFRVIRQLAPQQAEQPHTCNMARP